MSEHDSHEDAELSALYRTSAQQEPPAQLDAQVLAAARRHAQRHSRRWWLPLSTAALMVLAVSLLWRMELRPYELPTQGAPQLPHAPLAKEKSAAPPPAPAYEAKRQRQAEQTADSVRQARKASVPEMQDNAVQPPPPAKAPAKAPAPLSSTMAEEKAMPGAPEEKRSAMPQADSRAAAAGLAAPQERVVGTAKMEQEAVVEAPETWLKRIETLRAKGEPEAARRELVEFRKAYPDYPLPKALLELLPETAK